MVDSLDHSHEASAPEPKTAYQADVEQASAPIGRKVRGFSV